MIRHGMIALATAMLASCGTSEAPGSQPSVAATQANTAGSIAEEGATPSALPSPAANPSATPATASAVQGITSCDAEIGKAAAAKLAQQCTSVSPATRPPCNGTNSCAMIRSEIARACSVIDDGTPVPGCPTKPGATDAAADAIRVYYAAINARDYGTAYQSWDGDGERSGKSSAAFEAGFRDTKRSDVTIGTPGAIEGAAGSSYVTIPVTIRAEQIDGKQQRFAGSYVLRRSNQERSQGWHLYSASLKPAA